MLYLYENKKPAPNLENQKISKEAGDYKRFRNQVIHNGYIPTKEEVVKFGEHTFQHVAELLCSLRVVKVKKPKNPVHNSKCNESRRRLLNGLAGSAGFERLEATNLAHVGSMT